MVPVFEVKSEHDFSIFYTKIGGLEGANSGLFLGPFLVQVFFGFFNLLYQNWGPEGSISSLWVKKWPIFGCFWHFDIFCKKCHFWSFCVIFDHLLKFQIEFVIFVEFDDFEDPESEILDRFWTRFWPGGANFHRNFFRYMIIYLPMHAVMIYGYSWALHRNIGKKN